MARCQRIDSGFFSRDNHGAGAGSPSISAQQSILFINEAWHEETKRVDISCKLDNLLSREHMTNLTTQRKGTFTAAATPTRGLNPVCGLGSYNTCLLTVWILPHIKRAY